MLRVERKVDSLPDTPTSHFVTLVAFMVWTLQDEGPMHCARQPGYAVRHAEGDRGRGAQGLCNGAHRRGAGVCSARQSRKRRCHPRARIT